MKKILYIYYFPFIVFIFFKSVVNFAGYFRSNGSINEDYVRELFFTNLERYKDKRHAVSIVFWLAILAIISFFI